MSSFNREDRYIVIKYSDMEKLPNDVRRNFSGRCRSFYEQMLIAGAPARSFLVIESDWPEYVPVWQMIERRMTGQPAVTAAEELDAALHWRNKHSIAIKERDALQLGLNAADQRIDDSLAREAALPEDLAKANKSADTYLAAWEKCAEFRDASELKLTAAEQRNSALSDALLEIIEMNRQHAKDQYGDAEKAESWSCITVARAALKPTESGASE